MVMCGGPPQPHTQGLKDKQGAVKGAILGRCINMEIRGRVPDLAFVCAGVFMCVLMCDINLLPFHVGVR